VEVQQQQSHQQRPQQLLLLGLLQPQQLLLPLQPLLLLVLPQLSRQALHQLRRFPQRLLRQLLQQEHHLEPLQLPRQQQQQR
jgi:hypothetical protein